MAKMLNSPDCIHSSVEYWSLPPTQSIMETGRWVNVNPVGNALNMDTLSFEVAGSPDEFLDLHSSYILWDLKLVQSDGLDVTNATLYGPVNMLASSMWNSEELFLNGEKVTGVQNLANFAHYVETLLNFGPQSVEQLRLRGFYLDTPEAHDNTRVAAHANMTINAGLLSRKKHLMDGKTWKLMTPIPSELSRQPLLLQNRIDVKIVLQRAKPTFYLQCDNAQLGIKIEIKSAVLKLRKIKFDPEFLIAHEVLLSKGNASIYFEEKNITSLTMNQGITSFCRDDLFRGIIPKRVVVAVVNSSGLAGSYARSPYKVEHSGISQIGFTVNGESLPSRPIEFLPSDDLATSYRDGYMSLLDTTGITFKNSSLLFEADDWHLGYSFFAFSFEPDLGHSGCLSRRKQGLVGIDIRFSTALASTMDLVILYYRDSCLEIDSRRNPFLPYKRT